MVPIDERQFRKAQCRGAIKTIKACAIKTVRMQGLGGKRLAQR
jgi:hypothetical protein